MKWVDVLAISQQQFITVKLAVVWMMRITESTRVRRNERSIVAVTFGKQLFKN